MYHSLFCITFHEIKITARQAYSWLTPLLFFVMVVCLFPMAIGTDPLLLAKIAPGVIWVAALLAILISMNKLFSQDAEDGCLDGWLLSPYPLTLLVLSKIFSHWLTHCVPLILISPLLGFLLHLPANEMSALLLSLLLGTPVLMLLGAIGAALVVGIRSHGLLLPILIMPLYIPILIFGTSMFVEAHFNQPIAGYLAIMSALMLLSFAFAPFLTGVALRIGVNQ
jgi:heme exporter protein B